MSVTSSRPCLSTARPDGRSRWPCGTTTRGGSSPSSGTCTTRRSEIASSLPSASKASGPGLGRGMLRTTVAWAESSSIGGISSTAIRSVIGATSPSGSPPAGVQATMPANPASRFTPFVIRIRTARVVTTLPKSTCRHVGTWANHPLKFGSGRSVPTVSQPAEPLTVSASGSVAPFQIETSSSPNTGYESEIPRRRCGAGHTSAAAAGAAGQTFRSAVRRVCQPPPLVAWPSPCTRRAAGAQFVMRCVSAWAKMSRLDLNRRARVWRPPAGAIATPGPWAAAAPAELFSSRIHFPSAVSPALRSSSISPSSSSTSASPACSRLVDSSRAARASAGSRPGFNAYTAIEASGTSTDPTTTGLRKTTATEPASAPEVGASPKLAWVELGKIAPAIVGVPPSGVFPVRNVA